MGKQKKYKTIGERFDEFCERTPRNKVAREAFWCHMHDLLKDIVKYVDEELHFMSHDFNESIPKTFASTPEPKLSDVACRFCGGVDAHEPGCLYAG